MDGLKDEVWGWDIPIRMEINWTGLVRCGILCNDHISIKEREFPSKGIAHILNETTAEI